MDRYAAIVRLVTGDMTKFLKGFRQLHPYCSSPALHIAALASTFLHEFRNGYPPDPDLALGAIRRVDPDVTPTQAAEALYDLALLRKDPNLRKIAYASVVRARSEA